MSRTAYTPLIQQYLEIKARHPDALLFFRVGDFYEMFFEDAEEGSRLLGVTLTSRNNGAAEVPLAGIPAKALGEYLPRLVRRGRKVALCEQVEDPAEAEGLVRREVVEVITPGTVLEGALLAGDRNNFVAAVAGSDPVGIACADLSTGEFEVRACAAERLADELDRLEPAEVVLPEGAPEPPGPWSVSRREAWRFDPELAAASLGTHYGVLGPEGFGLQPGEDAHLITAAGTLVAYIEDLKPAGVPHLRPPRVERAERFVHLDEMTRRNLELVEPLRAGSGPTLLGVLDRTRTPMGGRLLRRWVLHPLAAREEIEARLDAVEELLASGEVRSETRGGLGEIRDVERLAGRLAAGRIAPRELLALGRSLAAFPALRQALAGGAAGPQLAALREEIDPLEDVREAIDGAIDPETPAALADGGVILPGHDAELDRLRADRDGAVEFIAALQARERERTGIESLKVGYNRVFGYYIEITRPNLPRVPREYERRQTLTAAERFVTPELKEWESRVEGAEAKIAELEAHLFRRLRERLAGEVERLQASARRVAELDVLASLAEAAARGGWTRPEVHDGYRLEIRGGRHPVVEATLPPGEFIPNDVVLDRDGFIMILTGPNMAGKSTILRQVGLLALLAQIGSFLPAARARVGLCDRVFTRVGASDDLAGGRSTFMVEMTETAAILNGATERSLLLLDEIGRGTSTYDGVAIAWALTEHVQERLGARTIFATHYHELVELADLLEGVQAFNVAVRETRDGIVFLRRLEPGGCDRSYGVHVARLAGLPAEVVERAALVLRELEAGPRAAGGRLGWLRERERGQLSLFAPPESPALRRLREMVPEAMTPLEALAALAELRELAEGVGGSQPPPGDAGRRL